MTKRESGKGLRGQLAEQIKKVRYYEKALPELEQQYAETLFDNTRRKVATAMEELGVNAPYQKAELFLKTYSGTRISAEGLADWLIEYDFMPTQEEPDGDY